MPAARPKSPTKCDAQLTESNFKTDSSPVTVIVHTVMPETG
ncbi:DUF6783 domain-containing protein [[Clostridium] symbiosum]